MIARNLKIRNGKITGSELVDYNVVRTLVLVIDFVNDNKYLLRFQHLNDLNQLQLLVNFLTELDDHKCLILQLENY